MYTFHKAVTFTVALYENLNNSVIKIASIAVCKWTLVVPKVDIFITETIDLLKKATCKYRQLIMSIIMSPAKNR